MVKEMILADLDTEESVLAQLLFNPRQIRKIADRLKPEHFYRDIHREMYAIALACYQENRWCTVDTMRYELRRRNLLATAEEHQPLGMLADSTAVLGDINETAQTLISEYTYRRLNDAAEEIHQMAGMRDVEALERAQALISDIVLGTDAKPSVTLSDAIDTYMTNLDTRRKDFLEGVAHGIPTGFKDLDHMLGGLQPSRLYTLAALTGYGKSSLAWQIALHVVMNSKRVQFFTLEMDIDELVQRALSMETEVDQKLLETGEIDDIEYRAVKVRAKKLKGCDLLMNDRVYSLSEIVSHAKKEHAKKPLNLIIVDYVQLMESATDGRKHETRAEEVAKLSRGLKRLARELKVPVLALAQVNRDVEKRQVPEPKLSDLNESGGIARDSDCVMFIYATEEDVEKRKASQPFTAWIEVSKHRNGRMGRIPLLFAPRITKFRDTPVPGGDDDGH